ncbi:alpha-L-fucosidase, partial [Candidatus Sumerlaeota bacterium]|nr:alpha-L-fucosidase [Candidatus Sumerlaeota bacterium]
SAGESGDWYARRLYDQGRTAYDNHLANYGHPSEVGYKEVLRDWNPTQLDPAAYVQLYKDAGARFLIIQGVHHDQFDNWDSRYQPWNASNLGPQRDLIGEWEQAAREADIRFGITFHHEYSWWWWQTAFQSDESGPLTGVPYDGNLTLADGEGQWWEGLDPRLLYGINLREYNGVAAAANTSWSPPAAGIFQNHLDFAEWYAKWWAARMMDAVDKYQPDFIYTDGTDQQPFSGYGTGTGYKCDAMQHVIADFYNKTLARRGEVDVFSIVKFRSKTNGTVNTQEGHYPSGIKTDQDWITENAVGDWYYAPGFTYSSKGIILYLLECVSRNGCYAVNIPMKPDGSLESACTQMFQDIGDWMNINGDGIYGSRAWVRLGEGSRSLPTGHIGWSQETFVFYTDDFRFTIGKDGYLYAWCMTVPAPDETISITSLGTDEGLLAGPIGSVSLLGTTDTLSWSQESDALHITCPSQMPYYIAVGFKIGPPSSVGTPAPTGLISYSAPGEIILQWNDYSTSVTYNVKRATASGGPYDTIATSITLKTYVDTNVSTETLYYYTVSVNGINGESANSEATMAAPTGTVINDWLTEDIGDVGQQGSFSESSGVITIAGSGSDIWYSADEFRYGFKALQGDFAITARVLSMQNTAPWAKAGVMIRETLDANSKYALCFMSPSNGVAFQQRGSTGGSASGISEAEGLAAPYYVRLMRIGNVISAYYSSDGNDWNMMDSREIAMSSSLYAGLAVCSVNDGVLCQAQFDNVTIQTGSLLFPSVTIGAPSLTFTGGDPVDFILTYTGAASIADNASIAATSVTLNATGTAAGVVTVTGTGTVNRTVTISEISGNGTLSITMLPGTGYSVSSIPDTGAGPSSEFTVYSPYADSAFMISADFGPADYVMTGAAVLGGGSDIWNSFTSASGTATTVLDTAGATLPGVSVAWSGATGVSNWLNSTNAPVLPEDLMRDYIHIHDGTIATTITGLQAHAQFELIVYALGDNLNQGSTITLDPANGGGSFVTLADGSGTGHRDIYSNSNAYARFTGTVDSAGTVSWTAGPDNINPLGQDYELWQGVNGFQIYFAQVQTPPESADVDPMRWFFY